MKKLFAIVLLVSAVAVIGCGDKKPAAKTSTPAPKVEEKKTEAAPAPPAAPPAGEKK